MGDSNKSARNLQLVRSQSSTPLWAGKKQIRKSAADTLVVQRLPDAGDPGGETPIGQGDLNEHVTRA
jgi:hypothetical protein